MEALAAYLICNAWKTRSVINFIYFKEFYENIGNHVSLSGFMRSFRGSHSVAVALLLDCYRTTSKCDKAATE